MACNSSVRVWVVRVRAEQRHAMTAYCGCNDRSLRIGGRGRFVVYLIKWVILIEHTMRRRAPCPDRI